MKNVVLLITVWCASLLVTFGESPTLKVSAAASLADVLKEVNVGFEREHAAKVQLNLGGSNALARQIESGAPADVFFSADSAQMDKLQKLGLIDEATRKDQLSNSLVIVATSDSKLEIKDAHGLTGDAIKKIAAGDPKSVPVGVYAREWLTRLQLWDKLESKIIATDNVRSALAAVESGNVEIGIVYKTDAAISSKVKVLFEVSGTDVPQITHPVAKLKEATQADLAIKYLQHLDSASTNSIFEKFGFKVLTEKADQNRVE